MSISNQVKCFNANIGSVKITLYKKIEPHFKYCSYFHKQSFHCVRNNKSNADSKHKNEHTLQHP